MMGLTEASVSVGVDGGRKGKFRIARQVVEERRLKVFLK
jgi:hypothetical protein